MAWGWAGWDMVLPCSLSSCATPFTRNKLAQDEAEGSIHHCVIPTGAPAEMPSSTCSEKIPGHSKTWDLKDLWDSSTPRNLCPLCPSPLLHRLLSAEGGQIEQESQQV